MKLPDQIKTADLRTTHPDFDEKHLAACRALYHGGRLFREDLDNFLIKRKIEDKDASHYVLRKRRSFYVPYAAGLLDWIAAAAFKDGIEIRVLGGSPEAKEYYESLNADADGLGTPLTSVATAGLLSAMKYGRAYYFPDFRYPYAEAAKPETLDARITQLDPCTVDDWQHTETAALEWVRMHCNERLRAEAEPWKQPQDTRDVWTFFDDQNITVFENRQIRGQSRSQVAKRVNVQAHGMPVCPVFDARAPEAIWVMDRIFEVAVALFNREASLTWALDMSAYATLVLVLDQTQLSQIVASELAALRLRPGENASYIAPPGGIYEPLFKDADRLKNNLYEVVRALGINASAIPQAGRMSGETVTKMREPMEVLLESFSQPILEALARLLDAVREKRGDDVELELVMGGQEEEIEEEEEGNGEGEAGDEGTGTPGEAGAGAAPESFRTALASEDRGG